MTDDQRVEAAARIIADWTHHTAVWGSHRDLARAVLGVADARIAELTDALRAVIAELDDEAPGGDSDEVLAARAVLDDRTEDYHAWQRANEAPTVYSENPRAVPSEETPRKEWGNPQTMNTNDAGESV